MRITLFVLFLLSSEIAFPQEQKPLTLWYNSPSGQTWENALPIGNGRLGAMVFGNVEEEIIQLNHHAVWSGSPNRNDNPAALASLDELRRLVLEGRQKEAENLANQTIISKKSHGQKFQPVGNLTIAFDGHESYSDFYRELDIARAVTTTSYTVGDVRYSRRAFASFRDTVVVLQLTANRPGMISFAARLSTPHANASLRINNQDLVINATTSDHEGVPGRVRFQSIALVEPKGGSLTATDSTLVVEGADEAIIYISIASSFNHYNDVSGNEKVRATAILDRVRGKSFKTLERNHVKEYQRYFDRVKLALPASQQPNIPTDERLKKFASSNDPQFAALYFQYGRYLLISSSQPGGQPANLQGIWNDKMDPPWDSKYTININAEMNYWPAEKTNLSELHEPFLTMVTELSETGKETAKGMYGARGWMAHHNTDIWRITGAVDAAFWGNWVCGGAWTSQHLWEHYLYNGDKNYLKAVYPALKGAAMFFVDYLVEHPENHWLVVNPDMSPENAPAAHQGSSIDVGTTMTNQIVFDVFSTAIRAAEEQNIDATFVDTLRSMRSRLAPMHIGRHGQLQEWLEDIDDPNDKHRHISHLYGLFPSNQISPYRTPELYSAARTTLIHRGDVSTGWSMGWKVNWWARLLDGNHAYKLIRDQLTPVGTNPGGGGTYNNLFDAHPPFQIDGNFGCTSGIAEMLVQSVDDVIHLLPALPDEWPSGTVSGLRAKGGFEIVDMQWSDGRIDKVVIRSRSGGNLRLRVPNNLESKGRGSSREAAGINSNPFFQIDVTPAPVISPEAGIIIPLLKPTIEFDIPTKKGKTYTLVAQ